MDALNQSHVIKCAKILQLPDELLLDIANHLNASDFLSLSATCKRLARVCRMIKHLNFECSCDNRLPFSESASLISPFLTSFSDPKCLRSCNLNGCYWITSTILKSFLVKCCNLEKLFLAETTLSIYEIVANILPNCNKVTSLSFTLRKNGWGFCDDPHLLLGLKKLTSVEVVSDDESVFFELQHFLNKCVHLEDLMVTRAPPTRGNPSLNNLETIGPFPRLKSLICIALSYSTYYQQFSIVEEKLHTFWSNIFDVNRLREDKDPIINLCWDVPSNRRLPEHIREDFRISTLESVREPFAVFMQSPESSPHLKLVDCIFDGFTFRDFCFHHQLIEVMKLRHGKPRCHDGTDSATKLSWNNESWRWLSKLRILSLDSYLIGKFDGPGRQPHLYKKWNEVEDETFSPFLLPVVNNCPLIQELELLGPLRGLIKQRELTSLSHCANLERLTLSNLQVANGRFLGEILKKCTKLQSLRLHNIGPPKACCYSPSLCAALPMAINLTTFCIFQEFIKVFDIERLMYSLECCTSLSRVGIICPAIAWNMPAQKFHDRIIRFCETLKQLVALFCVFKLPSDACQEANLILHERFRKKRPALRVDIQPANVETDERYRSTILPLSHSDILTRVDSQVANFPSHFNSILQRLN